MTLPTDQHDGRTDKVNHWPRRRETEESKLDRQAVYLLIVNGLFVLANALSGTFANVFLWKIQEDLALIAWFALSHQAAMTVTFGLGGFWAKQGNIIRLLQTGVGLSAAFYLAVLTIGDQAAGFIFYLGLLQGAAAGCFWLAFNVLYFEITEQGNRDRFNGWSGLLSSSSAMVAPWISSLLIVQLGGVTGYRVVFGVSLCVFIIAAIVSWYLKKRPRLGVYEWTYGWRRLKERQSVWRYIAPALAAQGAREGVLVFLVGVLIFAATRDEGKLGIYALITGAVSLLMYMLIGHWLKPQRRGWSLCLGSLLMAISAIVFIWEINFITLLIFGIAMSLGMPLFIVPMTSVVFDAIGRHQQDVEHRVEVIILRETSLNVGRMLSTAGFLMLLAFGSSLQHIAWFLVSLGIMPLLAWWWMRGQVHLQKP